MAGGVLSFDPSDLDFGSVHMGEYKDLEIDVTNTSTTDSVTLTPSIYSNRQYSIISGINGIVLDPLESFTIIIRYAPVYGYSGEGTLRITHDGSSPSSPFDIELSGDGDERIQIVRWTDKVNKRGDSLRIDIAFTRSDGNPVPEEDKIVDGDSLGGHLKPLEEVSHEYDIDDFLLVIGELDVVIMDNDGVFNARFFDPNDDYHDKRPRVDVWITYAGTTTEVLKFHGRVMEESPDIEEGIPKQDLTLAVAPETEILSTTAFFDRADNPVNPLQFSQGAYYFLTEIIEAVFRLINPCIDVSFYHEWKWKITRNLPGGGTATDYPHLFNEIKMLTDRLCFDPDNSPKDAAELLKRLASDSGCYAGVLGDGRAFFKKAFAKNYDTYTVSECLSFKRSYKRAEAKYASAYDPDAVYSVNPDGYYYAPVSGANYNRIDGEYVHRDILYGYGKQISGNNELVVDADTYRWSLLTVDDVPSEIAEQCHGQLLAYFWYYWLGPLTRCRCYTLEFAGLNYDPLKHPVYDNVIYFPVRFAQNLNEGTTIVEGIPIGLAT